MVDNVDGFYTQSLYILIIIIEVYMLYS